MSESLDLFISICEMLCYAALMLFALILVMMVDIKYRLMKKAEYQNG